MSETHFWCSQVQVEHADRFVAVPRILLIHLFSPVFQQTHDAEAAPAWKWFDAHIIECSADDCGHLAAEETGLGGQDCPLLGEDRFQSLAQLQEHGDDVTVGLRAAGC